MILVFLVIFTLCAYLGGVYISNRKLANSLRALFSFLLFLTIVAMIGNDTQHWGMRSQTEVRTTNLLSSVAKPQEPSFLLYKNLGTTTKDQIYLYRTDTRPKKIQHTLPKKTTNQVRVTTGTPRLVTKTQRWTYQGTGWGWLFSVAGNEGQRIKTQNTFYVGSQWQVLTPQKLKQLAKMAQAKAQVRAKAQAAAQN
ncbi:DUF4811 domain-containing protein [Lactobacillus sp. DCY120]|uniref:DUF4811 domain-containing protein n=1 Tax=Bombilactobacillus apium TaxID=2675299 RepID=A0A850R096_9LACO|nr:DUF4811 domain-containing protein [Bombilactobacillus apium]NVY96353.1 DUF4811 domain-containing protein [Bombilactobacillus apium]